MKHTTATTLLLSTLLATTASAATATPLTTSLPLHNPLTFETASTILGGSASSSLVGKTVTIPKTTASSSSGAATQHTATGITATGSAASASASTSMESSNMGTTQSIGGGKVVALVGALAAVVLCGL